MLLRARHQLMHSRHSAALPLKVDVAFRASTTDFSRFGGHFSATQIGSQQFAHRCSSDGALGATGLTLNGRDQWSCPDRTHHLDRALCGWLERERHQHDGHERYCCRQFPSPNIGGRWWIPQMRQPDSRRASCWRGAEATASTFALRKPRSCIPPPHSRLQRRPAPDAA